MDDLSIHGLPRITKHKSFISRLFWGALFIAASAWLFTVLVYSVQKYSERNFITKILKERQDKMRFPTLTICDTDMSTDFNDMKSFPTNCAEYLNKQTGNKSKLVTYGCKLFLAGLKDGCIFGTKNKCSFPKNFTASKNYDLCYSFNREGTLYQDARERAFGLEVLMFKNDSEVETYDISSVPPLRTTQFNRGLLLMVHPADEYIGYSNEGSIPLMPGTWTEVVLQKEIHQRLKAPYSTNCSSNTTIPLLFAGRLTESNCYYSCLLHKFYKECGDVLDMARPFMSNETFPTKEQNISKVDQCVSDVYANAGSLECDCNLPCYAEKYATKVSTTPLRKASFTASMRKDLANALNIQPEDFDIHQIMKHIVRLSVFYESFTTDNYIDHPLQDLEALLSNFGGLMGLFVGASVISVLELLALIVTSLFRRLVKRKISTGDSMN